MLRRHGQKSLYEAIIKAGGKTVPNKPPVESLPPKEKQPVVQQEPEPVKQKIEELPVETAEKDVEQKYEWPKKPKSGTFIGGRLELSLSYGVAVVLGLVLILALVLCFRLGQIYGSPGAGQSKPAVKANLPPPEGAGIYLENANPQSAQPSAGGAETAGKGSNRIVIKTYGRQQDLAPAKEYFDKNGIETEIIMDNSGSYKLVTKNKNFSNPNAAGTDGYQARQKIIDIGKDYKAPQGFEPFKFNDPYGEKVQ
jgi:hypothetical protein